MARAGDELYNPSTGHRLRFRRTTGDTGGELVEVESIYEAGSAAPPDHLHPSQEERFEVLEGEVRLRVAGQERTLAEGEKLTLAPGTAHAMWNAAGHPARLIWQTRPALRTEAFFETFWGPAGERGWTPPAPARALQLFKEFAPEIRLAGSAARRT